MVLFFIAVAAVAALLGVYLAVLFSRMLRTFGMEEKKKLRRVLSACFVIICFALIFLSMGYGVMILYEFLLASAFMEIINLILKRTGSSSFREKWKKIYGSSILSVLIAAAVLIYGFINVENVVMTHYDLTTEKALPSGHVKIALIADLHAGTTFTADEFREECDRIEKERPDVLLLAGDIFDEGTSASLMKKMTQHLGGIHTRYGAFYIFGNHDNGTMGNNRNFSDKEISEEMEKNGITVLTDETETVAGKIDITGRLDYSFNSYAGERASSHELLKDRDKKRFQLVMDHQPRDLKVNAKEGADLQVSGHTHAGQLWPLGLLGPVLRFNEMTYGIEKIGDMNCIVTSGIAVWGAPFRTEKHSEAVIINIEQSR